MKYMGSKNRLAKHLLPIILKNRKPEQWYVEPFVGGANMIDKVIGNRIGADSNGDLINLLQGLSSGWLPKEQYTKNDYIAARQGENICKIETGYISINCSYSGKYWGGFAGITQTKGGMRDYTKEAYKNVLEQAPLLRDIDFKVGSYQDLEIPCNSIIYCDPPYAKTTRYKDGFNHDKFWEWCREQAMAGHEVFISEYNAPDDFECIWSKEVNSSLSANGVIGGNKASVECLYIYKS